jgi:thiol-disulfide isomerase/thioredoxin
LLLVATRLDKLVGAGWLGAVVNVSLGLRALVDVLTRTLMVDLAFLLVGATITWLAAGAKREMGRAFDLACVAVLPLVLVDLVATVIAQALSLHVGTTAMAAVSLLAYAWTGMLVVAAVLESRRTRGGAPPVLGPARLAGRAAAAIVAIGVAVQITWIARHPDELRPLVPGTKAPALALPRIGPKGELGERVALSAGKITVLDFWATWCGPCLNAMPRLDALARMHPEIQVIAINLDDPVEARSLFDKLGWAPILVADDGATSARYGVTTIPHTVIVDGGGMIRNISRGTAIDLEATVAALR